MKTVRIIPAAILTTVLLVLAVPVGAATRTWQGETELWSNPDNWFPNGVPQNGDFLSFPDISPLGEASMNNDLPDLIVNNMTFTAGGYSLRGQPLTFIQGITDNHSGGGLNRIHCDMQFVNGGGVFATLNTGQLEINGTTTLANNDNLNITALVSAITVSGVIQGNGGLLKRGDGTVFLRGSGANTYTGPTRVEGGELHLAKTSAAQAISANVIIDGTGPGSPALSDDLPGQYPPAISMLITNGGAWRITNGATVTNLVLAERGVIEGSGLLTLRCDVTVSREDFPLSSSHMDCPVFLGDQTRTFRVSGSTDLWIGGQIIGSGPGPNSPGIIKRGGSEMYLTVPNLYFGPTVVDGGELLVYHGGALGGSGAGAETRVESGLLTFVGLGAIIVPEPLVLEGGDIRFSGGVTLTGPVVINQHCDLYGGSASTLEFTGAISGPRAFDVRGGTVRLSGSAPNTFGGSAMVVRPNDNSFFGASLAALELDKPDNVVAIPIPVQLFGSGETNVAVLRNLQHGGVADVSLSHGASWLLGGHTVSPTALTFLGNGWVDTQGGQLRLTQPDTNQLQALATPSNYIARILGNVACLAPTNSITVEAGVTLQIPNQVSGAGAIHKTGPGTLRFGGNNNFTGPLTVAGGLLEAGSDTALGAIGAGTTVLDGATLQIETSPALAEPLNLRGAGRGDTNGALVLFPATGVQAGIVLAADATVRNDASFAILSGVISGPGGLTKVGAGTLQIGGGSGAANTFSGDTIVEAGVLAPSKGTGVATIPGHLIIGGGGGLLGTPATVRHSAGFTIGGSVTLNRGGLWDLNGFSESFDPVALQGRPALTLNTGGDVQTGAGRLELPAGDVVVDPGTFPGASSLISGNLVLQPGLHRFVVNDGVSIIGFDVPEVEITATISEQPLGAAELVKEGPGEMRLSGGNSFTGPVTANAGRLTVAHARALGTPAAGTRVRNNAALALDGGIDVVDEGLTLDSGGSTALFSFGPVTNVWSGDILLLRTAGIHVPDALGGLAHSGQGTFAVSIGGPGGFIKSGAGALFIGGLQGGNSYAGPTTVTDGLLEARRRNSLSDDILVTGTNATLRTGRSTGLSPARTVLPIGTSMTVQNGALWSMNGTNFETLSRLVGDGRLVVSTGGALTISNAISCEFSGQLSGSGALNKHGLATFQVTGHSPGYTGTATVIDGTYKVDAQFLNSPVTVKAGSILRGNGVVGDAVVENGGVVRVDPQPGRSGGEFVMNSANFHNGGVLSLAFYGPHATGGNDHLIVNNAVTLTSPTLSAGFSYPPREGDVIPLINKGAAGAVSGAMSGFPEAALRMIGEIPIVASYLGGNGNDVTLTVTNLPLRSGGAQLFSGNGGSALVPDDCSQLWLVVTNRAAIALTGLHGTLRSLTEGVLVTQGESAFPNLIPNARGTNATPFQIRTEPTFPCAGAVMLELTLVGSNLPTMAIPYAFSGGAGTALSFDGVDDGVNLGNIPALDFSPDASFSIEAWINYAGPSDAANDGQVIVALNNNCGNTMQLLQVANGGVEAGKVIFQVRDGAGTSGLVRTTTPISSNVFHHVAAVRDVSSGPRTLRIYIDGVPAGSVLDPTTGSLAINAPDLIGRRNLCGTLNVFNGQIDEVRLWNTALAPAQIQTNQNRGLTGGEPNLLMYYRCDDGTGSELTDSAPAAGPNNGTLLNSTRFVLSDVLPFRVPGGPDCNSGGGACESCLVVSGQFDGNALEGFRRFNASGEPSVCAPPKPCPGFEESPDAPVRSVLHHFTNSSPAELCVTAQLRACPGTPFGLMVTAAYLNEFRLNQPCSFYLGDDGGSGEAFSFRVPPQTNIILVVTARVTNLVCATYSLELFGLPCPPPPLHIAKDTNNVLLSWSTAYPDYRLQSLNSLGGFGPFNFVNVTSLPALVSGKFVVTNATSTPSRYFRLAK